MVASGHGSGFFSNRKETTDGKLIGAKYRTILGGNQLEAEKDLRLRWSSEVVLLLEVIKGSSCVMMAKSLAIILFC